MRTLPILRKASEDPVAGRDDGPSIMEDARNKTVKWWLSRREIMGDV